RQEEIAGLLQSGRITPDGLKQLGQELHDNREEMESLASRMESLRPPPEAPPAKPETDDGTSTALDYPTLAIPGANPGYDPEDEAVLGGSPAPAKPAPPPAPPTGSGAAGGGMGKVVGVTGAAVLMVLGLVGALVTRGGGPSSSPPPQSVPGVPAAPIAVP